MRLTPEIRWASHDDEEALSAIDAAVWSPRTSPAEFTGRPYFGGGPAPEDVLVAVAGMVVGYVELGHPTPLPSNRHVVAIGGLAVHPDAQRSGVAGRLLEAAAALARERGARKISLRVLANNETALRVYRRHGFHMEGRLEREFRLDDGYVDDILMAKWLVEA